MIKVLFDTDNTMGLPKREIDDGLSLLYLLGRPEIELLGITTTFGNGTVDETYTQTRELLQRFGQTDIPLIKGQPEPGDHPNLAAEFLVQTTRAQPGEISLLATGPLTNLGAAYELDKQLFSQLRQVVCMGGYLAPMRIGWRNLPELNLSSDPNAAHVVLNAATRVALMSAQLCLQASFRLTDLCRVRSLDPWVFRSIRNWLFTFGRHCGTERFYLWDLVPAVYLSHPELFAGRNGRIASTVDDLMSGKLVFKQDGEKVFLPEKIKDINSFKAVLYKAWAQSVKVN